MADQPLRALTLWPEWAWAICNLGKRVENRPERVARMLARHEGLIALHAGRHVGGRAGRVATWKGLWSVQRGSGLENWNNTDVLHKGDEDDPASWSFRFWRLGRRRELRLAQMPTSAIVAVCRFGALLHPGERRPWQAPGSWAVELVDVVVLRQPVPCSGAQGLWTVPEEVAAAVLAQVPRPTPFDAMPGGGVCRCLNDASPVLCDDCPRGESGRPL